VEIYVKLEILAAALAGCATPMMAAAAPLYTLAKTVALGAPDRWDYVVFDDSSNRVYVAHGDRVTVVESGTGAILGEVMGIAGGTHGVAISASTGQGYTDDGTAGQAVAFDLQKMTITTKIPANPDADAIALEPTTGHVFVINGDSRSITVINPKTNDSIATIKAGEKMEYAVPDGKGHVYVAGEEKKDLLEIDARSNKIVARWATPECTSPHGLAIDRERNRLFMGCVNSKLMVLDSTNGKVVGSWSIGRGSDAVAFDPVRKRLFSSNGVDGNVTVYQQTSADGYELREPITTQLTARTMSLDPKTGRLFVVAADTDPPATAGGRPRPRPGTLKLLMLDPS
jgi:YVTN family beta-propeller protein